MKKLILGIVLLFCVNSYAINGFSIYKMYSQYDTVTHTNLDSNLNRPASWSSLLVDTLDKKFIRFDDFNNRDSTMRYFKVDTIRSNPNIDSITGNVVVTGSPTITGTLTVDTIKSTKGINATGGTFSGDIVVNSGQNITFGGKYGADIPTISGSNSGGSRVEFYPAGSSSGRVVNITSAGIDVVGEVTPDSLKLGTGSYLKDYVEGSFPCTLKTTHVTVQQIGTAYYTKIGKNVTISFPALEGTSNSIFLNMYCRIPYNPRQIYGSYYSFGASVQLVDNSTDKSGFVVFSGAYPSYIYFGLFGSNFTGSGTKGTYAFTISYITE